MSYTKKKTLMKRLTTVRSLKGFAQSFMLGNMAGQKLFLHNDRIPRVINISFNEKTCMFSCRMCPFNEDSVRSRYRKGTSMSMETLERLIDSVPNDPFYSFDMSSIGETLEFDRLPEFISRMKERRPLVNTIVSTNAVLLSEQYFNALIDSGLDSIQFSLYAENAEDHQFITGTKSFERVKNNIIRAGQIRSQKRGCKTLHANLHDRMSGEYRHSPDFSGLLEPARRSGFFASDVQCGSGDQGHDTQIHPHSAIEKISLHHALVLNGPQGRRFHPSMLHVPLARRGLELRIR